MLAIEWPDKQQVSAKFLADRTKLILFSLVVFAIPGPRIPGSRPFSPISNPGIGGVPIPGFWDCKN